MKATMYVILSTNNTQSCNEVVNRLKEFYSPLSISPTREYDSFDEDEDQWECYGMTSKIFHKDIDYIRINIYA